MENEVAITAITGAYWQAVIVIVVVVALAVGAFSLVSFWASRHIDTKFDKHAVEMKAYQQEVKGAIDRGTKEHDDWRTEMKIINEKVTDLVIEKEVERRMREQ